MLVYNRYTAEHRTDDPEKSLIGSSDKEVFELSRFEGLKYADIAEKLHISINTVEVKMSKALKLLRSHLSEFLTLIFLLLI